MRQTKSLRIKALNELRKANDYIRMDIDKFIMENSIKDNKLWPLINKLVENEIKQEELCD